jgi:putative redox protein
MKPGTCSDLRQHEHLRTSCGRDLTIGRLALGDAAHPAGRVFLDLGQCRDCDGSSWAGLSVAEARQLATALLSQAAAAGRDGQDRPGQVTVHHVDGDTYAITARGHDVLVDQPAADGGHDAAATPTELLVASLASCVAFYVGRYLLRHGLDRGGLTVTAEFAMAAGRPARVGAVRLRITVPGGVPPQRTDALLAVASHCTVHNTLRQPPEVSIELGRPSGRPDGLDHGGRLGDHGAAVGVPDEDDRPFNGSGAASDRVGVEREAAQRVHLDRRPASTRNGSS